jgi:hypothetical protein
MYVLLMNLNTVYIYREREYIYLLYLQSLSDDSMIISKTAPCTQWQQSSKQLFVVH